MDDDRKPQTHCYVCGEPLGPVRWQCDICGELHCSEACRTKHKEDMDKV